MASASATVTSRSSRAALTLARAASSASADRIEPEDGEGRPPLVGARLGAEPVERGLRLPPERGPALDAERPVNVGRAADGEEARLDEEGARAAHRVDEGLVAGVAHGAEDGGGERLLERSHRGPDAVAALVQRRTGDVEREREPGAREVGHDAHVGPAGVDVGAAAALAAESVHEGVLDLQRHEPGMGVLGVAQRGLDRERRVGVEVLLPGDLVRRVIEALRPVRLGLGEGPEQAHGDA